MRAGFKFKGRHTREFDVTVRTQSRPILPEMKAQSYDAPFRDGEYDFSYANTYNRAFYKKRLFKMDIKVIGNNFSDLQKRLIDLSRWLCGKGELVFDDTPTVIWDACVTDIIDYRPEHGKSAVLSVSFSVSPFSRLQFDVSEGSLLDSDIMLDSDIPLDMAQYFTFTGKSGVIRNIGDMPVRPIISVSGAASITVNGNTLTVNKACTIDCEKQTVTDGSGNSLMTSVSGVFFELLPGANTITLSQSKTVTAAYAPLYLYGTELEESMSVI